MKEEKISGEQVIDNFIYSEPLINKAFFNYYLTNIDPNESSYVVDSMSVFTMRYEGDVLKIFYVHVDADNVMKIDNVDVDRDEFVRFIEMERDIKDGVSLPISVNELPRSAKELDEDWLRLEHIESDYAVLYIDLNGVKARLHYKYLFGLNGRPMYLGINIDSSDDPDYPVDYKIGEGDVICRYKTPTIDKLVRSIGFTILGNEI